MYAACVCVCAMADIPTDEWSEWASVYNGFVFVSSRFHFHLESCWNSLVNDTFFQQVNSISRITIQCNLHRMNEKKQQQKQIKNDRVENEAIKLSGKSCF